MNTLEKLSEVAYNDKETGDKIAKELYSKFTDLGVEALIAKLKNVFKYAAVPDWVKTEFSNEKSYTMEVDSRGFITKINILVSYNDKEGETYRVDATLTPLFGNIHGGTHRHEMHPLIEINDMEVFLGIKVFE